MESGPDANGAPKRVFDISQDLLTASVLPPTAPNGARRACRGTVTQRCSVTRRTTCPPGSAAAARVRVASSTSPALPIAAKPSSATPRSTICRPQRVSAGARLPAAGVLPLVRHVRLWGEGLGWQRGLPQPCCTEIRRRKSSDRRRWCVGGGGGGGRGQQDGRPWGGVALHHCPAAQYPGARSQAASKGRRPCRHTVLAAGPGRGAGRAHLVRVHSR